MTLLLLLLLLLPYDHKCPNSSQCRM